MYKDKITHGKNQEIAYKVTRTPICISEFMIEFKPRHPSLKNFTNNLKLIFWYLKEVKKWEKVSKMRERTP